MRFSGLIGRLGHGLMLAVLVAFAIAASGCPFLIPTPGAHHGAPSTEVVRKIAPGVTTRVEIVMMLGDPDRRMEDDRYFVYDWRETRAVIGIVVPPGVPIAGGGFGVRKALALDFAPDGHVARLNVFSKDTEGLLDLDDERAATERALWEDIRTWMKGAAASAPDGAK